MEVEALGRLRVELDETTGLLTLLRRRPNAFNLHITESPLLEASPETPHPPDRRLIQGSVDGIGPQPIIELSTQLHFGPSTIARTLRCPVKHTAQRADSLEFEYVLSGEPAERVLLRVERASNVAQPPGHQVWLVHAHPYLILIRPAVLDGSVRLSIALGAATTEPSAVAITCVGTGRARLAVIVTSTETIEREPVLHALPVPLDLDAVALAVASPSSYPPRGGGPSRLSWVRPQPLLVFPRDGEDPARLGHVRQTDVSGSLRYSPMPDLVRRVPMAVFHGSAPLETFVLPLFHALKNLPPGQLSSLLSIIWFSPSSRFVERLASVVEADPLVLTRFEPHLPAVCENKVLASDDLSFDQKLDVITDEVDRNLHTIGRGMLPVWNRTPAPPVTIPRDIDLPVAIGLLGAARLRSGRPRMIPGAALPASAGTWPEMPTGSGHALCARIAECVWADVTADTIEPQPGVSDEALWRAALQAVRAGTSRLERLILVSVGEDDAHGLLKSLPAILYGSTPPAPVLAFRVPSKIESQIENALQVVLTESEFAAARIASGSDPGDGGILKALTGPHHGTWKELARALDALQKLLAAAVPHEYVEFIERLRPAEIIAFTNLPLEWFEVGAVPLGFLTKIAKVRVESRSGPLAALFDLVRVYNSLTETNYQPSPDGFKALCIAPHYDAADQGDINRIIDRTKTSVANRIVAQVQLQRDITLTMVDGSVDGPRMADHLREHWDLIIYIGHAADGRLQLSSGPPFDVSQIQHTAFEGSTVLLLGCTSEGVRDLAASVANEFAALGARGVFAMPARVHTGVMQELVLNLTTYLIAVNAPFGDTLQLTRFSLLYSYAFLHTTALYGEMLGRRSELFQQVASGKVMIAAPSDADNERFRDGWDGYYRHIVDFLDQFNEKSPVPAAEVARRAMAVSLNVTFMGSLRDRLFIF